LRLDIVECLKKKRRKIYGGNGAAAILGFKPIALASSTRKDGITPTHYKKMITNSFKNSD
jgi:hypothetical protein